MQFALDPSSFNEGQQRAIDRMHALEQAAARSAKSVEGEGLGVVAFFRTLDQPLASLKQHFENLVSSTHRPRVAMQDLAAEGRRTGAEVEAGAATGAAGLRALGVAGLGAFAVFKAVQTEMNAAARSAQTVFGTGVRAAAAGVSTQRVSAVSLALSGGNVPQEQTQAWLADWGKWQANLPTGAGQERFSPDRPSRV